MQYLDEYLGGQPGDQRDDDVRHDRAVGGGELAPDEKGGDEGGSADRQRGGGRQGQQRRHFEGVALQPLRLGRVAAGAMARQHRQVGKGSVRGRVGQFG